jgi:hypothetical protein
MAITILKYYELIQTTRGTQGKMRMAMLTGVPSIIAADVPDTPETIAKFRKAYKEITGKEPPLV